MISPRRSGTSVLVVSDEGYGKRSEVSDYRLTKRGGKLKLRDEGMHILPGFDGRARRYYSLS